MTAEIQGARHDYVRAEMRAVGFVPALSKVARPRSWPGHVPRRALVERLRAADGDVLWLTAPAGYGKTTMLAELAAADHRPCAWLSLDTVDNDPAVLLTYLALAMDEVQPVEPGIVAEIWHSSPSIAGLAAQRFGLMVHTRRPFLLVLDDVHELVARDALDLVAMLVAEMPAGSVIALGSRTRPPLGLARLRTRHRLVEVGQAELAFDADEAVMLFAHAGLDVSADDAGALVDHTEGWPAALYRSSLSAANGPRAAPAVPATPGQVNGDNRYVAEYLWEELLDRLDADTSSFLLRASCLDRLSGPLCDEVLERTGSAVLLEDLSSRNLLVIPLDDRREWYRFHHLLGELLRAELARRDPSAGPLVHRRASVWAEATGDVDAAITHAALGGDTARAEALVYDHYPSFLNLGRVETIERWLGLFTPDQLARQPLLMIAVTQARMVAGDGAGAAAWLARADALVPERRPADAVGWVAPVGLAVATAMIAPISATEMADEARYAHERLSRGNWHPATCLIAGAAEHMLGRRDVAVARFEEGIAATTERPLIQALCLAHLAVVHIGQGHWDDATVLARQARAVLGEQAARPASCLVTAVSSLVEVRRSRSPEALADRMLSRRHLTGYVGVSPWLNLQTRLALAHAALLSGDHAEAATLLDEVTTISVTVPDAVTVQQQLAGLRSLLMAQAAPGHVGP
ncbi:MAG: hypothetical protein ABW195_12555, partial [Ilumatobacteraceae bacterium]